MISTSALVAIAFVASACQGVVMLSIPLLASSLGADAFMLGAIGSAILATYMALCLVFSKISDLIGRRPLVSSGLVVYALASLSLVLCRTPSEILILASIQGVAGALLWPSLEGLLAEGSGERTLVAILSSYNVAWSSGLIIGTLGGGLFFDWEPQVPFYVAGSAYLLIAIVPWRSKISPRPKSRTDDGFAPAFRNGDTYLYAAWIANFLSYFALSTSRALFPKLGIELGMSATLIGSILLCTYLSQTLMFYLVRRFSRLHGDPRALLASPLLLLVAGSLLIIGRGVPLFFIAFLVLGTGSGISYSFSLLHSVFRPRRMSIRIGIHETILGLGAFTGPISGGVVARYVPFLTSAVSEMSSESLYISSLKSPYLLFLIVTGVGILVLLFAYTRGMGTSDEIQSRPVPLL